MIPMIPLGLKETKEIDFREPFRDFVLEHYSEEPEEYDDAVAEFMDVRQVWTLLKHMRTSFYRPKCLKQNGARENKQICALTGWVGPIKNTIQRK